MPTTTVAALPYPADSAAPDVPSDLQALAEAIDAYVPVCVRKTATETVTSSTTLQADNHLIVPLTVGAYRIQMYAGAYGSTSGDVKVAWSFSGSVDAVLVASGGPAVATTDADSTSMRWTTGLDLNPWGIDADSTYPALIMQDLLYIVSAPGTLTMYWAQGTSNGTGTTLTTQSRMYVQKVVML